MLKLLEVRREQLPVKPQTPYDKMRTVEALLPLVTEEIPIEDLTSHAWCDGVYCRKFFLPKDAAVVSKVHKKENWFLLYSGECSIYDGEGNSTKLKAPYLMVTVPGTKRIVYAHEDTTIYTFHGNPDNEMNLEKLEARYIIPEAKPTLPSYVNKRALLENKR
jgi:hypothetical protein